MEIIQDNSSSWLRFDTVKSLADGSWRHILTAAGIPQKFLSKSHGPCPCCGGRDRFRWDNKDDSGSFFCSHCGSGDGFRLVQLVFGCSPKESLNLVASLLTEFQFQLPVRSRAGLPESKAAEPISDEKKRLAIERVWRESQPVVEGDPVWKYLRFTRGLRLHSVPADLRFHSALGFWIEDEPGSYKLIGTYPAMVAAVLSPSGDLVSVHRTFLTKDGRKAPVPNPKKLMSPEIPGTTLGAAIRLQHSGHFLAITEGIETGLAVHLSTGFPVWAGMTANGVASLDVPTDVQQVGIFADNDRAGLEAARKLASQLCEQGRKVRIVAPPEQGSDWLDIYLKETA